LLEKNLKNSFVSFSPFQRYSLRNPHRLCIRKWKANIVTVTINPQVLAFGQEPSRETAQGCAVGEEPVFLKGGLEPGG